jgi:tetratricopeptide (TPR) repeat protein
MVERALRSAALRPDEPRRHTALGQALGDSGRLEEAISSFQKAADLAPDDWMPALRLEAALAEAGQTSKALDAFHAALSRKITNRWIYNPVGSAYIAAERYNDAMEAFTNQPADESNTADVQTVKILQGYLDVAVAAMEAHRAGTRNSQDAFQANEFLCGLYFATDRAPLARARLRDMAGLPAYPAMAERLASTASWARRLDDPETLEKVLSSAAHIVERWPNPRTQAVETHLNALKSWWLNSLESAENALLQSYGTAYSVWTLFDLAEFFTLRAKWDLAEDYWQKFDAHKGTVLVKGWFPGLLVMGWLQRAVAAHGRNDRDLALRASQKVLDHWANFNPSLTIVRTAQHINLLSKPH